jgi:hypothetical protein
LFDLISFLLQVIITISDPGMDGVHSYGMYQLKLVNQDSMEEWLTGISVHLRDYNGNGYFPMIYDPAHYAASSTEGPIQQAIDEWEGASASLHAKGAIVMIHPNVITNDNPEGAHLENLIMSYPVKLQGIGPGGDNSADERTRGTQLDGGNFGAGVLCDGNLFCDAAARGAWIDNAQTKAANLQRSPGEESISFDIGSTGLVEGQVLYVLSNNVTHENGPDQAGWITEALTGGVDGCLITGGFQQAGQGQPGPPVAPNAPEVTTVQGGGITLHSYTRFFRITNNAIRNNAGSFSGAVRVGTAFLLQETGETDNSNTQLTISRNSVLYNGGFNLAGAIGIFGGSHDYVIDKNHICGNNGQEYGGAISHFGTSEGGTISNNWILWNRAIDEGGGIIVAPEISAALTTTYPELKAGNVMINDNIIQGCVSGDDGGGLRFLGAGLSNYNVSGNIFTHNVALHEGGGVSINDAPFVTFQNNIVMNNIVSGTSAESAFDFLYAAGLATNRFSDDLRAAMATENNNYGYDFSHPQEFSNNIFWDNRASDGRVQGDGTTEAPTELRGLGMIAAETWRYDIGSSSGDQLVPGVASIIQNLEDFYDVPPYTCAVKTYLGDFFDEPPLVCDDMVASLPLPDSAPVVGEVAWGATTMTVQVQGFTSGTGIASQTFQVVVDPSQLTSPGSIGDYVGGPIGDYTREEPALSIAAPSNALSDVAVHTTVTLPEAQTAINTHDTKSNKKNAENRTRRLLRMQEARKIERIEQSLEAKSYTFSFAWTWLLLLASIVTSISLLMWKTAKPTRADVGKSDDGLDSEHQSTGNKVSSKMNRNGALRRFVMSLLLVLRFSQEAAAGHNCTLDCTEFGSPIPEQTKYQKELPIPEVIDLRGKCGESADNVEIWIKQADQDWGVKDSSGDTLLTPIYGYSSSENGDATYPGPTIVVNTGCQINVTFHNKLGIGRHMFPVDRTVNCENAVLKDELCTLKEDIEGTALPEAIDYDPDYFCKCISPNGSDRRTTVS